MTRRTTAITVLTAAALGGLIALSPLTGCQTGPAAAHLPWYSVVDIPAAAERVGTVDRTELLVAYYGSQMHDAWLTDLRRRHDAALETGEAELAAQLERQGRASQEHAHRQLAGEAGVEDILVKLDDILAAVAGEHDLDLIVESETLVGEDVQRLDVTQAVVERIAPARRES